MALEAGQTLLHYRLVEKIGEGGMGVVWRATDTTLDRDVAIKVLPPTLVTDPERLARFEREAKLLASLQHPNIASVFGFHETNGLRFLVMEYVPGEDLARRVQRGPLSLDDAIAIARQIAQAVEAAHAAGVIHRDLKPANIVLTADDNAKVLDFGLAKAISPESAAGGVDPSHSPTLTSAGTMAGVILGTARYMSPEQARGKAADARSDVFSFGCVLFEMLAAAPAFGGEDVSEILASVIKGDVQWDLLPSGLPGAVLELIERCLRVRPDERYQAIGDARIDLAAMLEHPERLLPGEPAAASDGRRLSRRAAALGIVLGLAIGLGAGWAFLGRSTPAPSRQLLKFRIPSDAPPRWFTRPAVSPDGMSIAIGEPDGLQVNRLDRLEPTKIDLPWPTWGVAWSKDGRTLVLARRDAPELWRVPAAGGEPRLIAALPDEGFLWGLAALDDETTVFGMADAGLFEVPLRGGTPERILAAEENEMLTGPWPLPGGRGILFAEAWRGRIEVYDGSERRIVLELEGQRLFDPLYSPSGHLLFSSQSGKTGNWAVPFSIDRLEVTGTPFRILPSGNVSVSGNDTLVYFPTSPVNDQPSRLVWVDRKGTVGDAIGEPLRGLGDPVLSPDDRRIVVAGWPDPSQASAGDVLILNVGTGAWYELGDALGGDHYPFWWSGGSQIGYVTFAAGVREVRLRAADGTDEPVKLHRAVRARATRDGSYLLYSGTDYGIEYLESGSDEAHRLTPEFASGFDLSPDHRVLAYVEPNQPGIFLRDFPDGSGRTAAVAGAAREPTWSRDGRELFFWRGEMMMVVEIDTRGASPVVGQPRPLFSADERRLISGTRFDIGPDGRFLMVQELEREAGSVEPPEGIQVIRNWNLEWTTEPEM